MVLEEITQIFIKFAPKMLNIIVLGAPCSGKGTQSLRISSFFNLTHLSTGDLLRDEILKNTPLGKLAQSYINKGELVPDEIVLKEIYKHATSKSKAEGIVFDGFPRTLNQAVLLDKSFTKKNIDICVVIFIDVDEQEIIKRMLHRSKGSNRSDDSLSVLENRVRIYKEQTMPLLDYYETQKKLLKISGMNNVEDVFKKILHGIEYFTHKNKI